MKLRMTKDHSKVRLQLTLQHAVFHEVWLAEAMKIVWEVWARMGWLSEHAYQVCEEDWRTFRLNEQKHETIVNISHFNRLVKRPGFDLTRDFDDGWACILQIIATIQRQNLSFQISPEITCFRETVSLFCLLGIKRGMDKTTPTYLESFIFTARDALYPQSIRFLQDQEIDILADEAETTVTLESVQTKSDPLFCFEITF